MSSSPPGAPPARPFWALVALFVLLLLPSSLALGVAAGAAGVALGARLVAAMLQARGAPLAGDGGRGVRLGTDQRGRAVVLAEPQLAAHGLILGASGAGKSTTLLKILGDHIENGRPVIAIDMKGSPAFREVLASAAAAAGRPLRVWTPEGPEGWNPLAHGNATELKDKLISTERFTEPHYQRAAERYVQLAIGVLHALHPERPTDLGEVVQAMDPRRLGFLARDLPSSEAARLHEYLSGLTPDQHSAIRGLGTRLAILSESHTGRFLEPRGAGGLDLRTALEGREVVLFSLNSSVYGKLAAQLGTLAIQDLVSAAGRRLELAGGASPSQALIGVDEFSALGADNVISLLARGRESGVSVLLATQELADLERAAPGFRDQVLGVTAVKIVHRQDVPTSAQTIAQMTGTERVWEASYRFGERPVGLGGSRGTRREVERYVVHPNEIKSLPVGQAVVITKVPRSQVQLVHVQRPDAQRGLGAPARPSLPASGAEPVDADQRPRGAARSSAAPRARGGDGTASRGAASRQAPRRRPPAGPEL